jgi:hypothetical protein
MLDALKTEACDEERTDGDELSELLTVMNYVVRRVSIRNCPI